MRRLFAITIGFLFVFVLTPQLAYANSPGPNLDGSFDRPIFSALSAVGTFILIYLLVTGFTCFIEWLVSVPFGMNSECKKVILITNAITQFVMHLLEVAFLAVTAVPGAFWLAFPVFIVILEILVYVTEFMVYRDKMLGFPTWQILLYTILANTASLMLGLLIIF